MFLFDEIASSMTIPVDARGATPFDSGGLWAGLIAPIRDEPTKRDVFAAEEIPLHQWTSRFRTYVDDNYVDATDYVRGDPPAQGVRAISNHNPPNEARAWTWEVRYPYRLASSRLRLERAFIRYDDFTEYIGWLSHGVYDDHELEILTSETLAKIEVYDDDSMAFGKAEAVILELI